MAADDGELGEIASDLIEIRDGPPRLGRQKGPGVADLEAKRDTEFDTLGIKRIIAAIIGR